MIKTTFKDKTIEVLQNRPAKLKLKQIAIDTGIPLGWIKMMSAGRIDDPSVCRTQTLYEYLTGKKLEF